MFHTWPAGPFFGPHLDFSWVWPLMIVFFAFGGWRRAAGRPHHDHRRHRRHELPSPESGDPALETLRQRFARGEIDRAEYEARRAALRGQFPAADPPPTAADGSAKGADSRPAWPDLS